MRQLLISGLIRLLISCLTLSICPADTLVTHAGEEVNGRVTYEGGTFTIMAKFDKKTKRIPLVRDAVSEVFLNDREDNPPNSPWMNNVPQRYGARDQSAANESSNDRLYFTSGDSKKGRLERLDDSSVVFSGVETKRSDAVKISLP